MRSVVRRQFLRLVALAALLPALVACTTLDLLVGDEVRLRPAQLQAQLDARFPRDYDRFGGLLSVSLMRPRLAWPGDGRVRVDFDVAAGTLGRVARTPSGRLAISGGLRFDAATQGLHFDDPRLETLDLPALGGALNASARSALDGWLDDFARREPLYVLDARVRERLGARRVLAADVRDAGIVVTLGDAR